MNPVWWEGAVRALLMACGAGLVLTVFRVRQPRVRHAVWSAVLLTMWVAWGPKISVPLLPALPALPATEFEVNLPVVVGPFAASPAAPLPRWTRDDALWAVWLGGCLLMGLHLLWGTWRIHALLRRARRDGEVLVSEACASPVTVGWLRPVIVMPDGWREWDDRKREAALAHEGEHARRRDPLVQWLAALNRCVFWFHPLSWWLERKLASLAEEVCDDAVLARGHDAQTYSEYLVEVARSVRQNRWRLGAAMHGPPLKRRIQRLHLGPGPKVSTWRGAAALGLSALLLLGIGACKAGRAAGQPTMNELMHRRARESREKWDAGEKRIQDALRMTPQQAQAMEATLKGNPSDQNLYIPLIRYYQAEQNTRAIMDLTLWYIERHPEIQWSWNIDPLWDRVSYERGKKLWLAHVRRPGAPLEHYVSAAAYMVDDDFALAGQLLEFAQKAYPDKNLKRELGQHFAKALTGSLGPVWGWAGVRPPSRAAAEGSYARRVRALLEVSNDAALLVATADALARGGMRTKDNAGRFELAIQYCTRAIELDPQLTRARQVHMRAAEMLRGWRLMVAKQPAQNDAERMWMLRQTLRRGANDQTARQLLELAGRNRTEAEYGNAILSANLALGEVALKRGDKREAVRYLLAASEAPPTDHIRYSEMAGDMTLARQLVDWGERDAVATYLERCSKLVLRGERMAEWARQIRQGINPDLIPYRSGG